MKKKVLRKFSLSEGVLYVQTYVDDVIFLRVNVLLSTGDFEILYNVCNLKEFQAEMSFLLRYCEVLDELGF